MSGLEVAGIILGTIPLLISGLEHYAEGASTIKRMFRAPREFRDLSRRLEAEHTIFTDTIETLLSGCVDDISMQSLLDNVGGDCWSEPHVDMALQKKLQKSYKVYLKTVEEMNTALMTFREHLQLGDDGKGPFHDQNSFREAFKRVKFGIRKADYEDLIDKIAKENTTLLKLTKSSVALEPARTTRRRIPNFAKVRSQAASMFSTLQAGLQGQCPASHRASLCMKPLESGPVARLDDEGHAFRLVLHHEFKAAAQPTTQWVIEETEVRVLDATAVSGAISAALTSSPLALPKGKKALRWQDPPEPATATAAAPSTTQQQVLDEIKDLCESIEKLRMSKCGMCLGYLQDTVNARLHGLYWPEKPLVDRSALTSVSLGALLPSGHQKNPAGLSVADSRRLALALSLGVLRLHDTPWLAKEWGRDDITLFKQDKLVLAEHPFVSTDLQKKGQTQGVKCSPLIRNEPLFALGIVLIELCMGQTFDSLLVREDLSPDGTKHAASDFVGSTRLLDQVYDRAGRRYGDAVRRCILCEFDQRKSSLEDDAFRKAVYDNVVAVLEEDVAQFLGL